MTPILSSRALHFMVLGALSIALGLAVSWNPAIFLAAFGAVLCFAILLKPSGRMFFVIAGSLITLQSTSLQLKVAFVAGLSVALGLAIPSVLQASAEKRIPRPFNGFLLLSVSVAIMSLLSFFNANANGTSFAGWFSSVLPYVLLATLPWIGIDAGLNGSLRSTSWLLLIVVVVAPLAFMTDWLERRGVSALGFGRFAYASIPLIVLGLAWSIAKVTRSRLFMLSPWLLPVALLPLAVLITGTRSALAMAGGLVGLIGRKSSGSVGLLRTILIGLASGVLAFLLFSPVALLVTGGNADFFGRRFGPLLSVGVSNDDASLLARSYQTASAWEIWQSHLFVGAGPGVSFPGVQTFDTPVAPLAYFGFLGVSLLAIYIASLARCFRGTNPEGVAASRIVARVFAFSMLAYLPLSSVLDDKGFSLAVSILCMLIAQDLPGSAASVKMLERQQRVRGIEGRDSEEAQ